MTKYVGLYIDMYNNVEIEKIFCSEKAAKNWIRQLAAEGDVFDADDDFVIFKDDSEYRWQEVEEYCE